MTKTVREMELDRCKSRSSLMSKSWAELATYAEGLGSKLVPKYTSKKGWVKDILNLREAQVPEEETPEAVTFRNKDDIIGAILAQRGVLDDQEAKTKEEPGQVQTLFSDLAKRMMAETLNMLSLECLEVANSKGWGDTPVTVGESLALCHSELSEALEEHRKGKGTNEVYYEGDKAHGHPVGVG